MSKLQYKSASIYYPDLLATQDLLPLPQQERSSRKRQQLLDTALILFRERGYEATTIEDISQQAGVAIGSFYRYFRSKRQMLLVLMDCLLSELSIMSLQLEEHKDTFVALDQMVRSGILVDLNYAGAYRAWQELIVQDIDLCQFNSQINAWTTAKLEDMLKSALQLPSSRKKLDIQTMAWLLNLLFWQLSTTPYANLERVVQAVTHLIYYSLFEDTKS